MELQVLSINASRLRFYAYKKYKNGNSGRHTALQCHIRISIAQKGSNNFSSGISGKLPKIATSNVIFSKTADCIAAKFCMAIKKIQPNDIFQNCVHSCSTLTLAITFLTEVIGLSYCTIVFLMTRPFTLCDNFDLLTLKFDLLLKNFNLGHNFLTRSYRSFLLILHTCIPRYNTFHIVLSF